MFFLYQQYTTVNFRFQGAFLLKKHEQSKNTKAKIVQNRQVSVGQSIEKTDVPALVYIGKSVEKKMEGC